MNPRGRRAAVASGSVSPQLQEGVHYGIYTLPRQVSTVVKLSTPLLFFFMTCLPTTLIDGNRLLCVPRGNYRICYTLHWDKGFTWTAAANECRRLHANGRLLTVLDKTTQSDIEGRLNGLTGQKPGSIWLGARLQFLDDWMWINNDVYKDTALHLQFSELHHRNKRGYVSARLTRNEGRRSLKMEVVPFNDPTRSDYARALCECQRTDLSECTHTTGKRYGSINWYKRWNEARNGCTNFSQTDLAVLSGDDIGVYETALTEAQPYFIGLRNVRLMWNLSESEVEAKYTNWDVDEPAKSITGTDVCVYASADSWKWHTKRCHQTEPFVCENVTPISTTAAATTSSDTAVSVPDGVTATPLPLSSSKSDRSNILVLLTVFAVVIMATIIIACVVLYFRRKLLQERQSSPAHQAYLSIPERHLIVIEEESAYSLINDADVTVVSYGTEAAATGNAPKGVPGYATVKKVPRDQPIGRSEGKTLTNNDKTRPTDSADQSTINLTVADGTGYYNITAATESHSQTSGAHESGYELLARRAFDNMMYMQSTS